MRVAVYARVSTEHEAQINALENQLEWYKIECSRHSDWEIVEVYVDQGITGTQAQKRPEFLRMMEDGKQVGRKKGAGFETKKSKAAKEKIRIHCKAFGGTLDDVECMKLTGLARNTYYKYKRQIRAGLADEGKT